MYKARGHPREGKRETAPNVEQALLKILNSVVHETAAADRDRTNATRRFYRYTNQEPKRGLWNTIFADKPIKLLQKLKCVPCGWGNESISIFIGTSYWDTAWILESNRTWDP